MIVEIENTRIAYDDVGRGAPVVFLHAFPLNRTMWAPQTSALAGDWRCLTIDIRGFGESPAKGPYSVDRYADDVAAVLDAASLDRAVVVGLSMGGYIAFALWRRHRRRVQALVLADTRANADTAEARERRRELIGIARTQGVAAVAERQVVGLLGKTTRERRPDLVNGVRSVAEAASAQGTVGALQAMIARPDSSATLPTISVPTLIVAGEEDVLTPPKEARAMHEAIRGSRLELIGEAGHLSNVERPTEFNAVLSEFLGAVESAS
jgi:pimeloyl-ACP methyl ester carboxylesterase